MINEPLGLCISISARVSEGPGTSLVPLAYSLRFCDYAFPYFRNQDRYNPSHKCTPNAMPIADNPVPDFPNIDVMMTHGPPMGILDTTTTGVHVGCDHLLRAARRAKPQLHCFGHIHEGWGAQKLTWEEGDDLDNTGGHVKKTTEIDPENMRRERAAMIDAGKGSDLAIESGKETLMVNASIMTVTYKPWNAPWLVDLDLERAD